MSTIVRIGDVEAIYNFDKDNWKSLDEKLERLLNINHYIETWDVGYVPFPPTLAVDVAEKSFPNLVVVEVDEQDDEYDPGVDY